MLSGATGQLYGNRYTWTVPQDWRAKLDTPGAKQLYYMRAFFASRRWQDLIPDQDHRIVISGYGKPAALGTGSVTTDRYATTAATSDGKLAISYLPDRREISVDLSRLANSVRAQWYDPSSGTYYDVPGTPFPNLSVVRFAPPGNNHDGDGDWVLLLEAI